MRVVAGGALMFQGFTDLHGAPAGAIEGLLGIVGGVLLLAGLWTPAAGSAVAVLEMWKAVSHPVDRLPNILLGTFGGALALVGPGAWSIDARLFGWRRIEGRDRRK